MRQVQVPERESKPVPVFIFVANFGVGVGVIGAAVGCRLTEVKRGNKRNQKAKIHGRKATSW